MYEHIIYKFKKNEFFEISELYHFDQSCRFWTIWCLESCSEESINAADNIDFYDFSDSDSEDLNSRLDPRPDSDLADPLQILGTKSRHKRNYMFSNLKNWIINTW